MHEYSIVQALLNQCEDIAMQNGAEKVLKIYLKIGVMSGVEPHLLKSAFDTFKQETMCADALLDIQEQRVIIKCKECGAETTLKEYRYICGQCESNNVEVIDGEEMYLMSLEME
ncbi:MAG: hydrogenase/urease nickel incorporation protein HypA [Sulfurovaceae bacterium]